MTDRRVVLRSQRDADGSRHLEARLTTGGDLVVEGHDLGPGVERAFGAGHTEYEWCHTVRAEHVPELVAVLGGAGDVLALLEARGAESLARSLPPTGPVPAGFWSRVGD